MQGMGVLINHAVTYLTSPIVVGLVFVAGACVLMGRGWRRFACAFALGGVLILWFFSTGLAYRWLGMGLEREFPPMRVEELPKADAIVVLGGGVNGNTNTLHYAELYLSADRVAHAARIWKAGKAPVIIVSGEGEIAASYPFLQELGVPADAILVENAARNTEQNARLVSEFVTEPIPSSLFPVPSTKPKVLLVTSAWHMRRALLLFRKYAPDIDIIPAACDYEATISSDRPFEFRQLIPNAEFLLRNSYMLKEYLGYWGYRLLR